MADSDVGTTSETQEEVVVPISGESQSSAIHEEVSRVLKEKGTSEVRTRVTNFLVEEKLEERKKQVLLALEKLQVSRKEVEQAKRKGTQNFGLDKKPVGEMVYTKQQAEEYDKAVQKMNKLEKALEKALVDGDYTKLQEAVQ